MCQAHLEARHAVVIEDLPIKKFKLPTHNIFDLAVLSWRWDHAATGSSRNLAGAIRYAKSVGIQWLSVDIVSLDQALQLKALIRQVLEFLVLYKTVSVIAAYDYEGERLRANYPTTMDLPRNAILCL